MPSIFFILQQTYLYVYSSLTTWSTHKWVLMNVHKVLQFWRINTTHQAILFQFAIVCWASYK